MFRLAISLIAFVAAAADAAPVYLQCQFDPALDKNHRAPMNVTLNEDDSTVTWAFANIDRVFTSKAGFFADSVAFGSSTIGKDTVGGFTIDRTDLKLRERQMDVPALSAITAETEFTYHWAPVGACALVQTKRAF